MQQYDYLFRFEDLQDTFTPVQIMSRFAKERSAVMVRVNDRQFLYKRQHQVPAHLADCIDVAVAVAVADRLSLRTEDRPYRMHLCLPVRHPELWRSIDKQLQHMLYWYTEDHWSFEFIPRTLPGRFAERESSLPFPLSEETPLEVALWSGGLDSLAGFYQRISSSPSTHYVLFGTGMNTQIYARQKRGAYLMAKQFPYRATLVQVPFYLKGMKELQKHKLQRSRSFVFLLLGAVCAALEGQQTLFLYENGIGAINLAYSDAEVGLDHSVSVHPQERERMGNLVSHLFGKTFSFSNAFLFKTKAQMCETLVSSPKWEKLVLSTFTCDRPHRERHEQCGYCSSCLLRRQALAVVGVEDPTPYITTTRSLTEHEIRPSYGNYLRVMLGQVESLRECFSTETPWEHVSERYPSLSEIVDEMDGSNGIAKTMFIEQLLLLYQRYVDEWEQVYQHVGCELWEGNDMMLPIKIQA